VRRREGAQAHQRAGDREAVSMGCQSSIEFYREA
jgi:hypothetical protein